MSDFASPRPGVARFAAAAGEKRLGLFLLAFDLLDLLTKLFDLALGGRRFVAGLLGCSVGLGPAGMDEPRLHAADLVGQLSITLGRASLAPQRRRALLLVPEKLRQSRQIGLRRAKLLLGILAAGVKTGDSRSFL